MGHNQTSWYVLLNGPDVFLAVTLSPANKVLKLPSLHQLLFLTEVTEMSISSSSVYVLLMLFSTDGIMGKQQFNAAVGRNNTFQIK